MPSERPTPWPGAVLEDPIAQLTDLLSPQGVSVTESKLIRVYDVRRYRSLVIEWTSYKDAPEIVDYESSSFEHINELKVLSSTTRDGTLQPQRIASGFSDEIFVAGVNANSQLIWWTRMPDPRVLRSEGANSEGRLSGRLYHRSRVEIRIYAPEEPQITEVKLYLTKPSGNRFVLMPLYSVPFVEQTPTGHTTHLIYGGPTADNLGLLGTFDGVTQKGQWLVLDNSTTNIRYLKILTTSSVSWPAWDEIEVYGRP